MLIDPCLKVLQELAIAPQYQSQGLGQAFMSHMIEVARTQKLNIALAASSGTLPWCPIGISDRHRGSKGTPSFYTRLSFEEVAPPICLASRTVEGVRDAFLCLEGGSRLTSHADEYDAPGVIRIIHDSRVDRGHHRPAMPWDRCGTRKYSR